MLGFDFDYDEEYLFHRKLTIWILCLAPIVVVASLGLRPPTYGKHLAKTTSSKRKQLPGLQGPNKGNHQTHNSNTANEVVLNEEPSSSLRKRRGFNDNTSLSKTSDIGSVDIDTDNSQSDKYDSKNSEIKKKNQKKEKHRMGPLLPAKWSWMFFESPCWIWAVICLWDFYYGKQSIDSGRHAALPTNNKMMLGWFSFHYLYRSIWYPLVMMKETEGKSKKSSKGMPLGIVCSAWFYCLCNGYLQARDLTKFRMPVPATGEDTYAQTPHDYQFWFGVFCIIVGFYIVITSDRILLKLKEKKQRELALNGSSSSSSHYAVPRGGFFEYVSSPHYFGELIEWMGFCIANDCSLASFSFVVFSASNLVPRAILTHKWYNEKFVGKNITSRGNDKDSSTNEESDNRKDDSDENIVYSELGRKAIIPFIL